MSNITFKQLGVIDPILQVCNEENFIHPTEIQEKSIPLVVDGKDVIGQAATGSGKTLAFASGIIQNTRRGKGIQALVITPTRELTQQVAEMISALSKYKPLTVATIYGGVSINPQIIELKGADVVIGTPGRLLDHIGRNSINLKKIKMLVLDECDRLLDMGFINDVERIIEHLPEDRQTLLYSATISFDISLLAQKYMIDPIDVEAEALVDPEKLIQYYYGPIDDSLKFSVLAHLLNDKTQRGLSLIFCNTRRYANFVSENLNKNGVKARAMHGGFSQYEREKRLKGFQNQKIGVLVATDVAARGLDIPGVTRVYNYDLPDSRKQYIHRIGRTARAGKEGEAITLVAQRDNEKFFQLFRDQRHNIQKQKIPQVKRIQTTKINRLPDTNRRHLGGNNRHSQSDWNRIRESSKPRSLDSRYSI
ncbi:MAG: DEAD/DEAH box helicase [Candidatus Heimdallarchaeota archaeon]|nr:DEAD/DEAH box helicase [Candidatus Heimdallarchaeota archaeon]